MEFFVSVAEALGALGVVILMTCLTEILISEVSAKDE